MKRAFVFPGQGSQSVGMGKALAESFLEAREVFEAVDETLKFNLSRLMFDGPIEELTQTEHTQPALMATSIAVVRVLEKQGGHTVSQVAEYVAGHSLGEYSALAAAGALPLEDAARLLQIRGRAMQQAVPEGQGGMAAIIGVDLATAEVIAAEAGNGDVCDVANDNSDGQVVISGTAAAIARGEAIAKEKGAKRYVPLNVSAPFHCALMQPAAEAMEAALTETEIHVPCVPLVANVTAQATQDPEAIRRQLVQQVTGRVRWRESVETLGNAGIEQQVEVGTGKVLSGLARRIVKDMEAVSIQTPQDVESFLGGIA